ncbi:hybrid sensor histidine kinase/response regulator [Owenweeksia hongkongensis]|uniref:hybrid sensor histidine kinase/response regulator n=1 Tax=Owenweeksia hongkongensis TaxID=253245 RepID=UPI003A90471F
MISREANQKIRVLYLDDEENNLKSFKAAFRREYDVHTAITSEKAFEIVKSIKPHVIFSDQRMPVTTGVEFFNAIRQIFPDPVRILVTGYTDVNDIIDAINKGHIHRYITKPWSEPEIKVAIDNAYDLYSTRMALDKKVEELEKSNHELSRFIYSASHDLRAPVASALGLIRVARHEVTDPLSIRYFDKLEQTTKELDTFVSNIIDYYKNSKQKEIMEEVSFEDLMEDVLEIVKSHLGSVDTRIDTEIDQQNVFKGDPYRIRIILSQLISNAIKFKKEDQESARIRVRITSDLDEVRIEVEDFGVGILKDHMHKVFQIFFKSSDTRSGSGIGLYIVKEALDKMGGSIAVDSKPGDGTLFSIKIPNKI